jgi:hypothetical protein
MNYRGSDFGLRSMSERKGHLFFSLLRRLGADWHLFCRVMIAQDSSETGCISRKIAA